MLIQNAIRTPDGTVLNSLHEHDCIVHIDKVNNFKYLINGGLAFKRKLTDGNEEILILQDTDTFENVRKNILIKVNKKWKKAVELTKEELQLAMTSKNLPPLKRHIILSYLYE